MGLPIVTERLRIREFTETDVHQLHEVYGDPEVMRWTLGAKDLAGTREDLRLHMRMQARFGLSFWALCERDGGALVGEVGLAFFEGRGPEVELGLTLRRDRWGLGYAIEAATAALEYGRDELELSRVVAVVDPDNVASQRVLTKVGMTPEGTREAYGAVQLAYDWQR